MYRLAMKYFHPETHEDHAPDYQTVYETIVSQVWSQREVIFGSAS